MKRICHIRSEKDYFLKKNYKKDFSSNEIFSEWENEVDLFLNIWNSEFCINYMEFRKLIRNTVINYIKKSNNFDLIFENNSDFHEYLNNTSQTSNIILYQQDDDDIFLNIPFNQLQTGVNRFMFTRFYYNNFLTRGFLTKTLNTRKNKFYLHSNNYVICTQVKNLNFNNYGVINNLTKSEWYMSHIRTTEMVNNYNLPVINHFNDIIALYVDHISSISNIKKIFNKSTDVNTCKQNLRTLVETTKTVISKLSYNMSIPIVPYGKEFKDNCITLKNKTKEQEAYQTGFSCIKSIGDIYLSL